MSDIVAELADRGRSLAPEDRSRLVELLLESLQDPPLSDIASAWDAEIVKRVAAYRRGEVETFAAEDVFAEARRIAPRSRPVSRSIPVRNCWDRPPTAKKCKQVSARGSGLRLNQQPNVPLFTRSMENHPQVVRVVGWCRISLFP